MKIFNSSNFIRSCRLISIFSLLFTTSSLFSQNIEVSGTVSDKNGPIPGVSITIEGSSNGTVTNFDGLYTL